MLIPPPDHDAGQMEGLPADPRRDQLPGLFPDAGRDQHGVEVTPVDVGCESWLLYANSSLFSSPIYGLL